MAITMNPPENVGGNAWRLSWTSDSEDPTFYIYDRSEGGLVATTKLTYYVVSLMPGESRVFEVLEAAMPARRGYPSRLALFWYAAVAAAHYRIEEYVGAAWTLRQIVFDRSDGHFHWRSRVLEDVTTHQFRVIPVGTNGNQGTAKSWSVLMVRYPDPPEVGYSYSNTTHKATIAAA